MKNHSELIKNVSERTLTAKGYKFLWRCIDIIAEHKGLNRYSREMRETKDSFSRIVKILIIDRGMTTDEVVDIIKKANIGIPVAYIPEKIDPYLLKQLVDCRDK